LELTAVSFVFINSFSELFVNRKIPKLSVYSAVLSGGQGKLNVTYRISCNFLGLRLKQNCRFQYFVSYLLALHRFRFLNLHVAFDPL